MASYNYNLMLLKDIYYKKCIRL